MFSQGKVDCWWSARDRRKLLLVPFFNETKVLFTSAMAGQEASAVTRESSETPIGENPIQQLRSKLQVSTLI